MFLNFLLALTSAFLITAVFTPLYIRKMHSLKYGQQIREDGPSQHAVKAGTPTMGGIVFIPVAVLVSLMISGLTPALYAVLIVTLGCGIIGFIDDYGKISRNRSLGLKARSKLGAEIVLTIILILVMHRFGFYSTTVIIPFFALEWDLLYFYPLFIFLVISASSNSVNLTDGLDGLAAGVAAIGLGAFAVIAWQLGQPDTVMFCAALSGSCLGFLIYNRYPARLFMGDTGSLALGGAFASLAIVTRTELILIIVGGVFVLEALSVIIQVTSFQLTGKRVFLMSPLHHHFEMKGWSEWKVVTIFWSAAFAFALGGVFAFGR